MEGAGGIGGLIADVDQSGGANLFAYDGNGNVSELVDASTGSIAAHYEYDAFGSTLLVTGTAVADNAWRFSTKQIDPESGLYYYGYRDYGAEFGRWTQRDPLGERGGLNLYEFAVNRPVDALDLLGADARVAEHFLASERRIQRRVHVGLLIVPGDCPKINWIPREEKNY